MTPLRSRLLLAIVLFLAFGIASESRAEVLVQGRLAEPGPLELVSTGEPSGSALPTLAIGTDDFFFGILWYDDGVAADTSDPLTTVFPDALEYLYLLVWSAEGRGVHAIFVQTGDASYSTLDPAEPFDFAGPADGPSFAGFTPSELSIDFSDPSLEFPGDRLPTWNELRMGDFPAGSLRLRLSDGLEAFEIDSDFEYFVPEPSSALGFGLAALVMLGRRRCGAVG